MNYQVEKYENRESWKKARGIGGSDAAAIVGQSSWLTSYDVWARIVYGEKHEKAENQRMIDGKEAEEHIRELFAINHRSYLKKVRFPKGKIVMYRRKDYPLMTLSPDSLFVDEKKRMYGVEIKDVELRSTKDKISWEENSLPLQYYYQVLYYMVIMDDLEGVYLNAHLKYYRWDDKQDQMVFDHAELRDYTIYRSEVENHINYLEKAVINFIKNNIETKKMPTIKLSI